MPRMASSTSGELEWGLAWFIYEDTSWNGL